MYLLSCFFVPKTGYLNFFLKMSDVWFGEELFLKNHFFGEEVISRAEINYLWYLKAWPSFARWKYYMGKSNIYTPEI